jgi:hypothetical protein
MNGTTLGVSVTRARKWFAGQADFSESQAMRLLAKKLDGVQRSTRDCMGAWKQQILHIFTDDHRVAHLLSKVYHNAHLSGGVIDDDLKGNTIIMVTVCNNADYIFSNRNPHMKPIVPSMTPVSRFSVIPYVPLKTYNMMSALITPKSCQGMTYGNEPIIIEVDLPSKLVWNWAPSTSLSSIKRCQEEGGAYSEAKEAKLQCGEKYDEKNTLLLPLPVSESWRHIGIGINIGIDIGVTGLIIQSMILSSLKQHAVMVRSLLHQHQYSNNNESGFGSHLSSLSTSVTVSLAIPTMIASAISLSQQTLIIIALLFDNYDSPSHYDNDEANEFEHFNDAVAGLSLYLPSHPLRSCS